MNINVDERERISTLKKIALRWSVYRELSGWIEAELALSASQNDKKSLENVSTKGGVSEAMVSALLEGASFLSSVERGIERCAELRSELCKNLAVKGKRKISRTWITSRDPGYYFFALKTNSWTEPRKFTVQS